MARRDRLDLLEWSARPGRARRPGYELPASIVAIKPATPDEYGAANLVLAGAAVTLHGTGQAAAAALADVLQAIGATAYRTEAQK